MINKKEVHFNSCVHTTQHTEQNKESIQLQTTAEVIQQQLTAAAAALSGCYTSEKCSWKKTAAAILKVAAVEVGDSCS